MYLSGKRFPTLDSAARLAFALGLPINILMNALDLPYVKSTEETDAKRLIDELVKLSPEERKQIIRLLEMLNGGNDETFKESDI